MSIDERIRKWADVMVNHSLASQFKTKDQDQTMKGKMIVVEGEVCSGSLQIAIEEEILRQGGFPIILPHFPNHRRGIVSLEALKFGSDEQVTFIPEFVKGRYDEMDGHIFILGSDKPDAFESVSQRLSLASKAMRPLFDVRSLKPWSLTFFPTEAEALKEGIRHKDYLEFVLDSCSLDYDQMQRDLSSLESLFNKTEKIVMKTYNPLENKLCELEMNKRGQRAKACFGTHNLPDGEVYTSPIAFTVEGDVFLDMPVMATMGMIGNVYLRFEKGKIVEYYAEEGSDNLKTLIETDEGSHQIGEFAFGTNVNITRTFKEILFVEKIGGSIHMAIGNSYPEIYSQLDGLDGLKFEEERDKLAKLGIFSKSAHHLDIPKDFRNPYPGEGIFLDGMEIRWNGSKWSY